MYPENIACGYMPLVRYTLGIHFSAHVSPQTSPLSMFYAHVTEITAEGEREICKERNRACKEEAAHRKEGTVELE